MAMTTTSAEADYLFPFGSSAPEIDPDPVSMGIKGANLVAMAQAGMPVPPGFVISVALGKRVAQGTDGVSGEQRAGIRQQIHLVEKELDREFGGLERPLLVSVRSGAAISMPGMMDTVLNLGLNDQVVVALAQETGDERFAWDTYRRFVQSFAQVVLDVDVDDFEDVLDDMRARYDVEVDASLPAEALKKTTAVFLDIVRDETGAPFPQDVYEQLDFALLAVFNSWNIKRAVRYREMQNIPHDGGTAAVIQAMVFGNRDQQSCTGVYFTRNPSTGERKPYGEYMPNAQGEDVVSGIRTPMELTEAGRNRAMSDNPSMEKALPGCFDQLVDAGEKLEMRFEDMQEIEFTVESRRLFLLQTRNGKRTPKAGLRIAVELAREGTISRQEAVARCDMNALSAMLVSKIEPKEGAEMFTRGLPASPGAAVGEVVFTSDEAVELQRQGKSCILVRPETDPKDVHGMNAATGILTSRGGMTSHAAVVARGMGKPCITAAMGMKIDAATRSCNSAGTVLQAGDVISLDGSSGIAYLGKQPVTVPEPEGELAVLLGWRDEPDG